MIHGGCMNLVILLAAGFIGVAVTAVAAVLISRTREKSAFEAGKNETARHLGGLEEKQTSLSASVQDLQSRLAASEELLSKERQKLLELSARAASLESQANRATALEKDLAQSCLDMSNRNSDVARLETMLEKERRSTEEKLSILTEARETMKLDFQNLAAAILDEKTAKFTEQNKASIDALMSPLREQLGEFKKRVEDVYDKESKDRLSLHFEIAKLKELNQKISDDAVNLTNALKGDNKAQGNWGELALERVLEMSGLQKGREYETQVHSLNNEGGGYRPDVVVFLPEKRHVIIDSKVSLVGYEKFCSAGIDDERTTGLRDHIASLRRHIGELSAKNYDQLSGLRSLDYVLLFVPIEAAFLTAIKEDAGLFSDGFAKNIILVCPSTLLVTLRTIANIWRNEYQNQNAQTIAKKAAELYDKFVTFVDTLDGVRNAIRKAADECDGAVKLLSTGKGNLVRRIEDFRLLGVKGKKDLPPQLVDSAESASEEAPPANE